MKELYNILLRPLITEKSTAHKETMNKLAFVVNPKANKVEIHRAVEKAFNVKVLSVATLNVTGKKKRVGRFQGKKQDWKKAIVTLAPGEHIDFFEGA